MATETSLVLNTGAATHSSRHGKTRMPYMVEAYVDFAAWTTAKDSALAAADILEVIAIPDQTQLLIGGIEVEVVTDGGATDLNMDWGYGGDDDYFVVAMDCDSGSAIGTVSAAAATSYDGQEVTSAADTLDLVIAGTGVDVTTGILRVWALILDVSPHSRDDLVADRNLLD